MDIIFFLFVKNNSCGDAYTAPVAKINDEIHYLHRDYLGSILAISDSSGAVVEERQFGAWGEVDFFKKNGQEADFSESILPRGFTGHEHFTEIALIHMNGRMYDPQLKRFLSPDNFISDPYDTRSYDRFAYVWQNPLMNNDPSGEIIGAIVIGAIIGALTAAIQGGNLGDILLGALIGGIAGGLGAGIANLAAQGLGVAGSTAGFFGNAALSASGFSVGFSVGFSGGFTAGFVGATLTSLAGGSTTGDALGSGAKAGLTAGILGGLTAGIGAGVKAKKAGANFWDGSKETPLVSSVNEIKTKGVIIEDIKPQAGDLSGLERLETGEVNYNGYQINSSELKQKLERFSEYLGKRTNSSPKIIEVLSGNRTPERNMIVGGALRSRHLVGDAVDIKVFGLNNKDLAIYAHESGLFNNTIYYPSYDIQGALLPHVHLDLRPLLSNRILIYTPKVLNNTIRHSYSIFNYK